MESLPSRDNHYVDAMNNQESSGNGNIARASHTTAMQLNDNKAGMQGLDTERINQIIEEASRGSKFYLHKQARQRKIDERIQQLLLKKDALTEAELITADAQMAALSEQLERERDLSRYIVHVDMDAFYAAVEMRDRPELRDVPMAVGSTGMLSTSNYAARRHGVRSAMPGFIGRRLCPQLVIVPCDFDKYRAASREVQRVLARYDPDFSMCSLDEAYLDITDKVAGHLSAAAETDASADGDEVAQMLVMQMRAEIQRSTQLTASAGIACNGMLAKICSDINKPDGQYFLARDSAAVLSFLSTLPCRKVSGIGGVMAQQLAALHVHTCGDLLRRRRLLPLLFSPLSCGGLLRAALGVCDTRREHAPAHQQSVSCETTFAATADRRRLQTLLAELCGQLAADATDKRLRGRTVTVKLKTDTFETRQRSKTLHEPVQRPERILATAGPLLARETAAGESFRLIGVRLSALQESDEAAGSDTKQVTLDQMYARSSEVSQVSGGELGDNADVSVNQAKQAELRSRPRQATLAEIVQLNRTKPEVRMESSGPGSAHSASDAPACRITKRCQELGESHNTNGFDLAQRKSLSSASFTGDVSESAGLEPTCSVASAAALRPAATCPICSEPLPDSLALVNTHVDECLNRQCVAELVDGTGAKRPAGSARHRRPAKHRRIESFFTVR